MSTTRRLRATRPAAPALEPGIAHIRREMDLPQAFPGDVLAAAAQAAANPRLPGEDRSDIPFVTVDPPGAMDLDQALHVARDGDGSVVYYAIADVAAFVPPGDPVDLDANRRGEPLYDADDKVPLPPPALSEAAASVPPGELRRAMVRSRQRLDYEGVQQAIDAGQADPMFEVLREIGELRMQREVRRGGVSLPLPDQEIRGEGSNWRLEFRARCPIEDWNEQISLLTGMAAAHLMLEHGVGLLRTLPEPPPRAIGRLRRSARALGIDWPASRNYPDFIRSLNPANPRHVAMLVSCTSVLRGAGYVAFEGDPPPHPMHSALA